MKHIMLGFNENSKAMSEADDDNFTKKVNEVWHYTDPYHDISIPEEPYIDINEYESVPCLYLCGPMDDDGSSTVDLMTNGICQSIYPLKYVNSILRIVISTFDDNYDEVCSILDNYNWEHTDVEEDFDPFCEDDDYTDDEAEPSDSPSDDSDESDEPSETDSTVSAETEQNDSDDSQVDHVEGQVFISEGEHLERERMV